MEKEHRQALGELRMKYPFKFTHYWYDSPIFTAYENSEGVVKVNWNDHLYGVGNVDYTANDVKKYIEDGTWKIIEEKTSTKEPEMKPITENIKIKVNPEQSAIVQEICFKNGIDWSDADAGLGPVKAVKFADMPALLIDVIGRYNDGKCLYWQGFHDYNAERHTKEYTFEQFVQEFGEQPAKEAAKLQPRKHAELIKAWADGAMIQYWSVNDWFDCVDNQPTWDDDSNYRIKPAEPEKEETVKVMIYSNKGHLISITESPLSEAQEFVNKHSNNIL